MSQYRASVSAPMTNLFTGAADEIVCIILACPLGCLIIVLVYYGCFLMGNDMLCKVLTHFTLLHRNIQLAPS